MGHVTVTSNINKGNFGIGAKNNLAQHGKCSNFFLQKSLPPSEQSCDNLAVISFAIATMQQTLGSVICNIMFSNNVTMSKPTTHHTVPKKIDFPRYNITRSRENVILRRMFHVVSCFPLHFMLYRENLDCFFNSACEVTK